MMLQAVSNPVEQPQVVNPSAQPLFRANNGQLVPDDDDWAATRLLLIQQVVQSNDDHRRAHGFVISDVYIVFVPCLRSELDTSALCELMDLLAHAGTKPAPDDDDLIVKRFCSTSLKEAQIQGVITADRIHTNSRRESFAELLVDAFNRHELAQKGTIADSTILARQALTDQILKLLAKSRAFGIVIFAKERIVQKVVRLNPHRIVRPNGSIRYRRRG